MNRERIQQIDSSLNVLSGRVIAAAIEVHRALGPGLLEQTYEAALCVELGLNNVRFERQAELAVMYKGVRVGRGFADLMVEKHLVVELKAVNVVQEVHVAQVLSYLRASNCVLGLLINFNVPALRRGVRRVVLTT